MKNGVFRTNMAEAFSRMLKKAKHQKLDRVGRMVVRQTLTNEAKGVGVIGRPRVKKEGKPIPADSAVMKKEFNNVGVEA